MSKNIGYGNAVNLALKHVDTKYFLAFWPDIDGISLLDLFEFINVQKNRKIWCLGPRYINNKTNKNLIQTNRLKKLIKLIVYGAVLFFDKNIW